MKILKTKDDLKEAILNCKHLGFVPTMGSLHKGHISLIKNSQKKSNKTIVSIFINPKQFNNKLDFKNYPRNLNKDIKRGDKFQIKVNGEISKVSLISTGSTTHAQGSESKFRNIIFSKLSDDKIEIQLDNNSNNLQNGTYLLFVLNSKGVPSEGKIVYVN